MPWRPFVTHTHTHAHTRAHSHSLTHTDIVDMCESVCVCAALAQNLFKNCKYFCCGSCEICAINLSWNYLLAQPTVPRQVPSLPLPSACYINLDNVAQIVAYYLCCFIALCRCLCASSCSLLCLLSLSLWVLNIFCLGAFHLCSTLKLVGIFQLLISHAWNCPKDLITLGILGCRFKRVEPRSLRGNRQSTLDRFGKLT